MAEAESRRLQLFDGLHHLVPLSDGVLIAAIEHAVRPHRGFDTGFAAEFFDEIKCGFVDIQIVHAAVSKHRS